MSDLNQKSLFDSEAYLAINEIRWPLVEQSVLALRRAGVAVESAFDLGCGPGWFTKRMDSLELDVVGLEARSQLVDEARRQAPRARIEVFDFDAVGFTQLPKPRDFVLCFGLLYHLENPLRALRIARRLAKDALLLETMIVPGEIASARLVRENANETQGVRDLAMILTQPGLEQALWAAGFENLRRRDAPIDHDDFRPTAERHKRRCVYFSSSAGVTPDGFTPVTFEPPRRADYWKR